VTQGLDVEEKDPGRVRRGAPEGVTRKDRKIKKKKAPPQKSPKESTPLQTTELPRGGTHGSSKESNLPRPNPGGS